MQRKYYIQELDKIRTLAKEFARDYPSLAPMLAEDSTDPDVERLLEGFAYLTANVQEKLDQQLPELSKSLCQIFFPECLVPTPSVVMMQFKPRANASHAIPLKAGAKFASQVIDEATCKFELLADNKVEPIVLHNSEFKETDDGTKYLRLNLSMLGTTLTQWDIEQLPFYITGEQQNASDLYLYLMRYCKEIGLQAEGEAEHRMPGSNLIAHYFQKQAQEKQHYKKQTKLSGVLVDYLVFPQTFLRPCITGLSSWQNRGHNKNFTITFYFTEPPHWFSPHHAAQLNVNTFPAINLFLNDAEPIRLNYENSEYPLYIMDYAPNHYAIFDVVSVETISGHQNNTQRQYYSMEDELYLQNEQQNLYELRYSNDEFNNKVDVSISFCDTVPASKVKQEVILVKMRICNGALAEHLLPGQINQRGYGSPENIEFTNLHVPSKYYPIDLNDMFRWRLISLISYNYLAEGDLKLLKEIILLRSSFLRGYNNLVLKQKLDSISNYQVTTSSLLYYGSVLAGYDVNFTCQLSGFITKGEIYIFGEMLASVLASSLQLNVFIRLAITIAETGEGIEWPARTYDQILA